MSLFHYMASSIPLPLGERGGVKSSLDRSGPMPPKAFHFLSNGESAIPPDWLFNDGWQSSLKDEEIAVYDSMEDAAGIYIDELTPNSEAIRQHFVHPYVYRIAPNWGSFHFNPEIKELFPDDYKASVKCVTVLFDLMRNIGDNETSFELYSCWIDEEQKEKNEELTQTISLSAFRLGDNFKLKDRQYFFIVK